MFIWFTVITLQFASRFVIDVSVKCATLMQKVHKQNYFTVPKECARDLPKGKVCLNVLFAGVEVRLHSWDCCFDSGVTRDTTSCTPVTIPIAYSINPYSFVSQKPTRSPVLSIASSEASVHTACRTQCTKK